MEKRTCQSTNIPVSGQQLEWDGSTREGGQDPDTAREYRPIAKSVPDSVTRGLARAGASRIMAVTTR